MIKSINFASPTYCAWHNQTFNGSFLVFVAQLQGLIESLFYFMKIKENVTTYSCDFCDKKLFRKNAMINHEVKCSKNPLNQRACFLCDNLEKVDIEYSPPNCIGDEMKKSTCFLCANKYIFMFPPKVEHSSKGIPDVVYFNDEEISQERMPIECDFFKEKQYFV